MGPWCESGMTTGVADVHLPCRRAEEALWGNRESFSSVLEAVSRARRLSSQRVEWVAWRSTYRAGGARVPQVRQHEVHAVRAVTCAGQLHPLWVGQPVSSRRAEVASGAALLLALLQARRVDVRHVRHRQLVQQLQLVQEADHHRQRGGHAPNGHLEELGGGVEQARVGLRRAALCPRDPTKREGVTMSSSETRAVWIPGF